VWGRGKAYTGFWWGIIKERPRHRCDDNIKMDLGKWDVGYGLDRSGSG